ncbi:MAG: HEAT repeat domain-containing protein [Desulfovibrionaceae bacterium]
MLWSLRLLGGLPPGPLATALERLLPGPAGAPGPLSAAWAAPLALHLGAALVLILPAPFSRAFYPMRSTIYGLTAAITLTMPAVGILGCFFARGCAELLMRHKNKTAQFRQAVEMSLGEDAHRITRKRVGQVLADEIAIEPVVDVLAGNDPDLKRGAVKLLKRMATPGAVALLRNCMSDPFPEVRFYAHSALSELEDGFAQRIKGLRERLESAPSAALWRALGRDYDAYAGSGLVDEVMRRQTLEEGRAALAESLALEPGHAPTQLLYARVLLELDDLDEAKRQFERCAQDEATASEAMLGLAQIAYQRRDMRALAMQARAMATSQAPRPADADHMELFEFWAKAGAARHD